MLKFLSWSNRDDIEKRKFDKWNEYLGRIKMAFYSFVVMLSGFVLRCANGVDSNSTEKTKYYQLKMERVFRHLYK